MKATKLILASALTAALGLAGLASAPASAATYSDSGTITINGQVLAETCQISFSNATTSGNDATVTLPTVFASAFDTQRNAGNAGGSQPFDLQISNCGNGPSEVTLQLQVGSGGITTDGDLQNTVSGGSNVAIRFQDRNGASPAQIDLTSPVTLGPASLVSGGYTFHFGAEYYLPTDLALGSATAGLVSANVTYTVTYQ